MDKIKQGGGTAIAVPGDMLNAKHIDELVKKAAEFGGGKIHIMVNNAGFTWVSKFPASSFPSVCNTRPHLEIGAKTSLDSREKICRSCQFPDRVMLTLKCFRME